MLVHFVLERYQAGSRLRTGIPQFTNVKSGCGLNT